MDGRLPSTTPDRLDPEQLEIYRELTSGKRQAAGKLFEITDDAGELYGPFASLLVQPQLGMAIQRVGEELRFNCGLAPAVREIVILAVAAHVKSGYEWYAHVAVARSLGVPESVLVTVKSGGTPHEISAQGAAALRLVGCVLSDASLDDAGYAEAKETLSETGVMEVVSLVGYYRLLADLIRIFEPPVPEAARGVFVNP